MSPDAPYQNREIDERFNELERRLFHEKEGFLPRMLTQVTKTNGRVTKLERNLLIVACIVGTLLATSGSEITSFVMSIL